MTSPEAHSSNPKPSLKLLVRVVVLWVVGCALGGVVVASINGEFGSILFAGFGVALGLAGAVAHVLLLLIPAFRSRPIVTQSLLLWLATLAALLALSVLVALPSEEPSTAALRETVSTMVQYISLPALLAAVAVNWLANRAAA